MSHDVMSYAAKLLHLLSSLIVIDRQNKKKHKKSIKCLMCSSSAGKVYIVDIPSKASTLRYTCCHSVTVIRFPAQHTLGC